MGISNVMVHWFERLHNKNAFAGMRSVLDFGPQDIVSTPAVLANYVASVQGIHLSEDEVARQFNLGDSSRLAATRRFYAALGLEDYKSLDLRDKRADYSYDLNGSIDLGRRFDVVTNFGTLEHIFSIGNVLASMHEHLSVGGLALHVLPTRGDYNHGFYNIHSVWYRDLAAANAYEIIDLVCVPDFGGQHEVVSKRERWEEPPPRRSKMIDITRGEDQHGDERFSRTSAFRLFLRRWNPKIDARIYDYIFAAFRKTSDAPFIHPQQGVYALKG
jgi:SAM-dependent methyltransferase